MFRSSHTFILISLCVLAVVLRLYDLSGESLWVDEIYSLRTAQLTPQKILTAVAQDNHPPLYPLFLHYWMYIFGDSVFSLRLLSCVFGCLIVLLSYRLAREFMDPTAALVAIAMITVSYFLIHYAQEVRSYTLALFFALLSVNNFWLLLNKSSAPRTAFYTISTILLLYTHYLGFFILLSQCIYVLYLLIQKKKHWSTFRYVMLALGIVCLLYLPWLRFLLIRVLDVQREFWVQLPDWLIIPKTLLVYAGTYTAFGVITLLIMAALLIFEIIKKKKLFENDKYIFLVTMTVIPVISPLIVSVLWAPVYIIRITIVAAVFFYFLVAHSLTLIRKSSIRSALTLVLLLCMMASLRDYYTEVNKERWKEAVQFIEQHLQPEDLMVFSMPFCIEAYRYYAQNKHTDLIRLPQEGLDVSRSEIEALVLRTRSKQHMWLVLSHARDETLIQEMLQRNRHLTASRQFISYGINSHQPYIGIRVQRYSKHTNKRISID